MNKAGFFWKRPEIEELFEVRLATCIYYSKKWVYTAYKS